MMLEFVKNRVAIWRNCNTILVQKFEGFGSQNFVAKRGGIVAQIEDNVTNVKL